MSSAPAAFALAVVFAAPPVVRGSLEGDVRFGFPPDEPAFVERARTTVGVHAEAGIPHLRARLDARATALGHPPEGEARLTAPAIPWRLDADDAWLEGTARAADATLRVRAGVQTIRWGSGLLFNPESVVNPPDLDDPLRYGSPLGNAMLRAEWLGPVHVDLVAVPWARPPLLPEIDDRRALLASGIPAAAAIARDPSWTIALDSRAHAPAATASQVAGAVRLSGRIPVLDLDAGAMAWTGRLQIPQVERANLSVDLPAKDLSGGVTLGYPRATVAGGDLAGTIPVGGAFGDAGVFAEASWTMPAAYSREVVVNGLVGRDRLLTSPYLRAAAGLDHTFGDESYLALEYVRGFPDEIGAGAQRDYAMAIADRGFAGARLHARIVAFLAMRDRSALLSPELSFTADAVTVSLGAWTGFGAREATLGRDRLGPPIAVARVRASF